MYTKSTRNIRITVQPQFIEDESSPLDDKYVWAYHVEIENLSDLTIQLKSRKWSITDADGITEEVSGEGIVGEQPTLEPGDAFEYTSAVALTTPSGIMTGTYHVVSEFDETFDLEVPPFSLDSPFDVSQVH